jgi:N-acetylglutamate synthase-like GNAT family acetyltransferase
VRYAVLREPWGHPRGTEKDDFEALSQHFMAVDEPSGKVVGVVKWLEMEPGVAWLSHLAVLPDYQSQKIGLLLVDAVETAARQKGYTLLGAHARLNATEYFEKLGFQIKGLPSHLFGTVQTVWMEKSL